MKRLIMLVGPPGSGKSTLSKTEYSEYTYINQDSQGKQGHREAYALALSNGEDIVLDKMNFSKFGRADYLSMASDKGYETKIVVLHVPYVECLERILKRQNHETIKDEKSARSALQTFFTKYEPVDRYEAHVVVKHWPKPPKEKVIWSDIDGTVALVEHRRHFVRGTGKKNWTGFFNAMSEDSPNLPVIEILERFRGIYPIVYCSGRPETYRKETQEWLNKYCPPGLLFMRHRNDSRQDDIVKQIILDFEIKTRYDILFCLDDRDQVVKMLRNNRLSVFQVAEGDF